MPHRATKGSAGYDGFLPRNQRVILKPHGMTCVNTGVRLQPPEEIYCEIKLRSSFGSQGIYLASGGLIDTDYTGTIKLILFNLTQEPIVIKPDVAFYQIVFHKHVDVPLLVDVQLPDLEPTQRGEGGFGSTSS